MNKTRNLEVIQADIIYLSKEKQGFLARLFNSNDDKIKDLRIEEKKAINQWLYENDEAYRNLSHENIALLSETYWELKIINHTNGARHMRTGEIKANIEKKGYMHGRGFSYYLFPPDVSETGGYVNALGEMQLYHIQKFTQPDHTPKAFTCFTDGSGSVHIKKTEQEFTLFAPKVLIGDVIGDPFNGNSSKRKTFLRNRQLMLELAEKQVVSP